MTVSLPQAQLLLPSSLLGEDNIYSIYIMLHCTVTFVFMGVGEYRCASPSIATCLNPLPPVNGYIRDYTSIVKGSVVTFYCNEGLAPEGRMNATCGSNGSWTPNPAEVVCTELPPKGKCQFLCSVAYFNRGSQTSFNNLCGARTGVRELSSSLRQA